MLWPPQKHGCCHERTHAKSQQSCNMVKGVAFAFDSCLLNAVIPQEDHRTRQRRRKDRKTTNNTRISGLSSSGIGEAMTRQTSRDGPSESVRVRTRSAGRSSTAEQHYSPLVEDGFGHESPSGYQLITFMIFFCDINLYIYIYHESQPIGKA